jgi:hypothetical protein
MEANSTLFTTNTALGGEQLLYDDTNTKCGSGFGGAAYAKSGAMVFQSCAFTGNGATGGIDRAWNFFFTTAGDGFGGAVYSRLPAGSLTFINCTLAGNSANGGDALPGAGFGETVPGSGYGGAIFGDASLLNSTLSSNSVQIGSTWPGTLNLPSYITPPATAGSSVAGTVALTNTILVCAAGQTNLSGQVVDGGHNISSDASAHFTSSSSREGLDPLLAPLADNGGVTPTCALLPMSPAIDSGDDSVCPATDQRGVRRPQGLHCDIGAFELALQATIVREANGAFAIKSQFAAASVNEVLTSTNLIDWVSSGTSVADTNGAAVFEDMGSPLLRQRFYQLRIRPAP